MKNKVIHKTSIVQGIAFALMILGASFSFAFAEGNEDGEAIVGTARISESKALSVAEKAYTGTGVFTDIELEMEKGVLVYAVEYTEKDGNEVDVKVNAKTGAVVTIQSDKDEPQDDDMNDDEGDADKEDTTRMQTLINLLNQLIVLLRQQSNE